MRTSDPDSVLDRVRRALGRTKTPRTIPAPPLIDERVVRLVHTDLGLGELFARRAGEMNMRVTSCYVEECVPKLIESFVEMRIKRVMLSESSLLRKLEILPQLRSAGFDAKTWDEITLDESYDFDASVTDAWRAVAETGSLVLRASPGHGRAMSLVPVVHVAIVEPRNFVADLLDLFELIAREGVGSATTLISGPSKTADIEMNVVTGVHGPNVVNAFVLQ